MSLLTKRVQVLFPQEVWEELTEYSLQQKESVGSLIRKAVEQAYLTGNLKNIQQQRQRIVSQLAAMSLPVCDWETMEVESTQTESVS